MWRKCCDRWSNCVKKTRKIYIYLIKSVDNYEK